MAKKRKNHHNRPNNVVSEAVIHSPPLLRFPSPRQLVHDEENARLLEALLPALQKYKCLDSSAMFKKTKRSPWVRAYVDLFHPAGPWGRFSNAPKITSCVRYTFKNQRVMTSIYKQLQNYTGNNPVHRQLYDALQKYKAKEEYYNNYMTLCRSNVEEELQKAEENGASIPLVSAPELSTKPRPQNMTLKESLRRGNPPARLLDLSGESGTVNAPHFTKDDNRKDDDDDEDEDESSLSTESHDSMIRTSNSSEGAGNGRKWHRSTHLFTDGGRRISLIVGGVRCKHGSEEGFDKMETDNNEIQPYRETNTKNDDERSKEDENMIVRKGILETCDGEAATQCHNQAEWSNGKMFVAEGPSQPSNLLQASPRGTNDTSTEKRERNDAVMSDTISVQDKKKKIERKTEELYALLRQRLEGNSKLDEENDPLCKKIRSQINKLNEELFELILSE